MKKTILEAYEPAMKITTQEEANAYFEQLVNERMAEGKVSREKAESIEKQNLGFYAGYYDDATRVRVEKLFMCTHPIFGAIANGKPTEDEALEAGRRMAPQERE